MKPIFCLFALSALVLAEDKAKPTFEEKLKDSTPLKLEAQVVKKGDVVLQVTPLLMKEPFVADWFADGPRSLKVEGDKLQVLFKNRGGKYSVQSFKLPAKDGKIEHDTSFGDKGIAEYDRKKSDWKPREDFGDWGDDIKKRPLGKYIGRIDKEEEKEKGHQLIVEDAEGKEVAKLGFVDKSNKVCWLHNFCSYKDFVVLVDGNCRDIDFWTLNGKHLFSVDCRTLGLDYPWVQAIDITEDGTMYLGFTQKRPKGDGKGKSGIQEAAFLKITGLDTIKTAPQ